MSGASSSSRAVSVYHDMAVDHKVQAGAGIFLLSLWTEIRAWMRKEISGKKAVKRIFEAASNEVAPLGAIVGSAVGSAISPGIGTFLGGVAGSVLTEVAAKNLKKFISKFCKSKRAKAIKRAYKFLGVSPNATDEQLKEAYKLLAMKVHPDKGGKTEEFQELQFAYGIILAAREN